MAEHSNNGLQRAVKPAPCVVVSNYKGGVGKSLTCRLLAQGIIERKDFNKGKRVLIVEMDPQGNLGDRWGLYEADMQADKIPIEHPDLEGERSALTDLWLPQLGAGPDSLIPVPYETFDEGIDFVPVNEAHLHQINRTADAKTLVELSELMISWLRSEQIAERYSVVLIDTQPTKTPIIDIALLAGTHCYIPFIPQPQAVRGVYSILTYIVNRDSSRRDGTSIKMLGLLPNQYEERVSKQRERLLALRKHPVYSAMLMPFHLAKRTIYSDSDDGLYDPGSMSKQTLNPQAQAEVKRFTDYIIKKLQEDN